MWHLVILEGPQTLSDVTFLISLSKIHQNKTFFQGINSQKLIKLLFKKGIKFSLDTLVYPLPSRFLFGDSVAPPLRAVFFNLLRFTTPLRARKIWRHPNMEKYDYLRHL